MSFINCADCGYQLYALYNSQKRCRNCINKSDDSEFDSDDSFRCPKCREVSTIQESENFQLYAEDGGDVTCTECNHEFYVNTSITYSFTSPEMEEIPPTNPKERRDES